MANMTKVIFAGDAGSGKTVAIRNMAGLPVHARTTPTVGCVIHPWTRTVDIFDIGGRDVYSDLRKTYYSVDFAPIMYNYEANQPIGRTKYHRTICVLFGHNWRRWQDEISAICPNATFVRFEDIDSMSDYMESL